MRSPRPSLPRLPPLIPDEGQTTLQLAAYSHVARARARANASQVVKATRAAPPAVRDAPTERIGAPAVPTPAPASNKKAGVAIVAAAVLVVAALGVWATRDRGAAPVSAPPSGNALPTTTDATPRTAPPSGAPRAAAQAAAPASGARPDAPPPASIELDRILQGSVGTTNPVWVGLWARAPKEVYFGTRFGSIARWDGSQWNQITPGYPLGRPVIAITGPPTGCGMALGWPEYESLHAVLWRGMGSTGCLSSPMVAPTSWP